MILVGIDQVEIVSIPKNLKLKNKLFIGLEMTGLEMIGLEMIGLEMIGSQNKHTAKRLMFIVKKKLN